MADIRNEFIITTEIEELKRYRHSKITDGTMTVREEQENGAKIKALNLELQAILTEGAEPCPNCGKHPIGMHRVLCYEVGCDVCDPEIVAKEGYDKGVRVSYSSQGRTKEEAVYNWNKRNYIFDTRHIQDEVVRKL
jgi:antitoxin component YwqK of YwqJK toxin-antitoxin module